MTKEVEHNNGQIRVFRAPFNPKIPYWISIAWIANDLVLPCLPVMGYSSDETDIEGNPVGIKTYGVDVPQDEALSILETFNRHAAKWWRDNGFPQTGKYFHFEEKDIIIISGVTHQKIILHDEMDGSPHR